MNDKHQGPHCAGSCEGAAYQIEIRRLKAENDDLDDARTALEEAVGQFEAEVDELRQALEAMMKDCKDRGNHINALGGFTPHYQSALSALAAHGKEMTNEG